VLFHEASHQFTSLAGGPSVPAWLNEGMASFFEGTRLLSNGRVDWNLVAPGRLYPLVDELRGGARNRIENVIQGRVDDYRVYYPWGWGIVYYLYNAEDENGRLLYRHLLPEYFQKYSTANHLERFVQFFVERAKVPGVRDLEEFERRFIAAMLRLEAEDKGQLDAARAWEERGDLQIALSDWARAIELYDRSLQRDPDHPEVLWKLAHALERAGDGDRCAGVLRQWLAVVELEGGDSPVLEQRRQQARDRIEKLDQVARRLEDTRRKFFEESVNLARRYEEKALPRTALRVLRGPATAQPPSQEARALYFAIQERYGLELERWELLFNERDLSGFYGDGQENFRVQDGVLLASFEPGAGRAGRGAPVTPGGAGVPAGRSFQFRRLFIDREPAGDWSLSAEIFLGQDARLAGLCFGKKEDGLYHGVGLLPEGFLDLSRFATDATPLFRTKVKLAEGWNRLQLDVSGTRVLCSLNGEEILDHQFESRAQVAGDFGLLIGTGRSSFRELRLREYDRSIPRRTAIGRRRGGAALSEEGAFLAPERAAAGAASFLGQAPPALRGLRWANAAPAEGDLDLLLGWPLVLCFTKSAVERDPAFSCLPALEKCRADHPGLDIPMLVISNERHEEVVEWVRQDEVAFPVASGWEQEAYQDYGIARHGIPRALLVDIDGTVVWEGNPDFDPEHGSYLDEPLAALVARRKLWELLAAGEAIEAAEAAFLAGDFGLAGRLWKPVAALDVPHPRVQLARNGQARLEERARDRIQEAVELAAAGRRLEALALLRATARDFTGSAAATEATRQASELAESRAGREALRVASRIQRAERVLVNGKLGELEKQLRSLLEKSEPGDDPWVAERARWLLEALAARRNAGDLLEDYLRAFPTLEDPRAAAGP
jgi:hypothetical protein